MPTPRPPILDVPRRVLLWYHCSELCRLISTAASPTCVYFQMENATVRALVAKLLREEQETLNPARRQVRDQGIQVGPPMDVGVSRGVQTERRVPPPDSPPRYLPSCTLCELVGSSSAVCPGRMPERHLSNKHPRCSRSRSRLRTRRTSPSRAHTPPPAGGRGPTWP